MFDLNDGKSSNAELLAIVEEMYASKRPVYSGSPEGNVYLKKMLVAIAKARAL